MRLKKVAIKRFAGLKDKSIEFENNLNVIYGPNEAGKSTIINAISSLIFKKTGISARNKEDKTFKNLYMPYPEGDYIGGSLILDVNGSEYRIDKEWGARVKFELEKPDGTIIVNETDGTKEINSIFSLGDKTYNTVVFAKQSDIKNALEFMKDSENVDSIKTNIRKAYMELDGVSIDKLKVIVDAQIQELIKKWDMQNERPVNDRGINDPYLNGYGKIYESYIKKENIKALMGEVQNLEMQLNEINKEITDLTQKENRLQEEITTLSSYETDAVKRAEIEPELKYTEKEIAQMQQIMLDWPSYNTQVSNNNKALENLQQKMDKLILEEKNVELKKRKNLLKDMLDKIAYSSNKINELKETLNNTPIIDRNNIKELDDINKVLLKLQTAIKAGTMYAKISNANNKSIKFVKDFDEEKEILSGEITANGYLKFIIDEVEIEIKSGEFDFDVLKNEYEQKTAEYEAYLKRLNVRDIDEAKEIVTLRENLQRDIDESEKILNMLLNGRKVEEIIDEYNSIEVFENVRNLNEIIKEKKETEKEIFDLRLDTNNKNQKLTEWQKSYQSPEALLNDLIQKNIKINNIKETLKSLKSLPDNFESVNQFTQHLNNLRLEHKDILKKLDESKQRYYDIDKNMQDESYEDLNRQYLEWTELYNKNIQKANKLLKIKSSIENIINEDENPVENLEESFCKYISLITSGKYGSAIVKDEFDVELVNNGNMLPTTLLSAGTYDSVALAFRFALAEQIFKGESGFIVLDDCLVDLDNERKKNAVKLIKEFAKTNQVIFTTCDENTRDMLGGNLINLK